MIAVAEKANRRLRDRWRLRSPSGAVVVSLRQLNPRERLRVTAPSMLTTGNMACGFSAVLLAFGDQFAWAAALLSAAIVLDIADGAVARFVGATSPFGIQLDSLADLVSFGVAPAVLVHTWALPGNPVVAWLSAFFWLACAGFRLARFNVTVDPLADKKYFVGLPSPGATLVVIATILALDTPEHGPWVLVPVAVSVVPALLMVTTVRFRSFRGLLSPRTRQARTVTTALGTALVAGLVLAPAATGLVVACAYLLTPPLGLATASLRAAVFGPQAVAPPRTRSQSVFLPIVDDDDEECAAQIDRSAHGVEADDADDGTGCAEERVGQPPLQDVRLLSRPHGI